MTPGRGLALRTIVAGVVACWAAPAVAQGDGDGDGDNGDDGKADPAADADKGKDEDKADGKPAAPDPNAPLTPPESELPPVFKFERIAAKGFYSEAGIGAAFYIGGAAPYSAIGPSFAVRIGYDLFLFFSIGIHLAASSHEATVPPP